VGEIRGGRFVLPGVQIISKLNVAKRI